MSEDLKQEALAYHEFPSPGKISVELTTSAETQHDLALAYSPGVAEPCREIAADPLNAYRYTGKGNLVAVISNGPRFWCRAERSASAIRSSPGRPPARCAR